MHSTYARCVWQSILFISFAQNSADISHHKSTNKLTIVTIVHIFRFTKRFGCKSVARGHRLFDWRSFGCLGKTRALMSKVSSFLPLTSFNWDALSALNLTLQDDLRSEHIYWASASNNIDITSRLLVDIWCTHLLITSVHCSDKKTTMFIHFSAFSLTPWHKPQPMSIWQMQGRWFAWPRMGMKKWQNIEEMANGCISMHFMYRLVYTK